MKDYHSILGVNPWASQDEIKQAYRRLASKFHPDHGGDREKFQQIQTAYQNLSDTSKKKFSDIPIDRSPPFFHQNLHSTFDFFNRETRPRTIKISLWLDLRDLLTPQKKVVSVVTGRGAIHNVEIDIPVKLDDGQAVRYEKLGPQQEDLVVFFRLKPDPVWTKSNSDLITDCPVSIWTLICGGEQLVEDPVGSKFSVTIPPMTRPDTTMRIRGRGCHNSDNSRGDILLKIRAQLPDSVPDNIMNAIRQEYGSNQA